MRARLGNARLGRPAADVQQQVDASNAASSLQHLSNIFEQIRARPLRVSCHTCPDFPTSAPGAHRAAPFGCVQVRQPPPERTDEQETAEKRSKLLCASGAGRLGLPTI
eukprot:13188292-Alexandrium_andersonii.AAC.1